MRVFISLAALLTLILSFGAGPSLAQEAPPAEAKRALLVDIQGPIGPAISAHASRAIAHAQDGPYEVVILRIDTPGGLDTAMRDIIKAMLASQVPVAGYVAPSGARAASAGTYILYAAEFAAMAPATNLGAATPISIAPAPRLPRPPSAEEDEDADTGQNAAERKAVNDAVAYIRGLAQRHQRNADWAEQAVRSGASLSAQQALEMQVIDAVLADLPGLLKWLDGRTAEAGGRPRILQTAGLQVEVFEPDWRTRLLAIITNPTVAYMLMMIGIYGLILEGYNPGALVPGVIGGICLLVALFAFQILPVNGAGLALILLGLGLITAEAFVPSFGILGLGGISAFVIGSVMLMDTEVPGYQVPLGMVGAMAVASVALVVVTMTLMLRARRHALVSGPETLIGAEAEAQADFSQHAQGYGGWVWLEGELWQAACPQPVAAGQRLRVVSRSGLILHVQEQLQE